MMEKQTLLRRLTLLLVACLVLNFCAATSSAQNSARRFFPTKDLMRVGVYYYPEHWPREQWERDFANMEKMGFEFVHMAEFAWAFMEPAEGKFDFEWLDTAVELAARHHLKVILCTPTPTPPAWLYEKYPNAYLVGADGRRREHGSRGNNALADSDYLRLTERVVTEMAKRYGRNPAVWGWQLDNEPQGFADYSPSAQTAFRDWLKARYKTVDVLNREWGANFWSLKYNSFDQVIAPNPTLLYGPSPHAILDFRRFSADQIAKFLNWQAALIRRHALPSQWITTNYISNIGNADPRRSDALDFISYTMYPVSGGANLGEEGFRLGWPDGIAFANSFYRSIKGVTGVMELQPGQVNWAWINPQPMPGVVRMWLWHAFAGGCSFACTYRYRQPLYGSEQYHYGIVGTDGVSPSPGGLQYSQVAREMRELRAKFNPSAAPPADYAARRTAILWNHENLWNIDQQKQTGLWDTWGHMFRYMGITKSFGAPLDYLSEADDFSRYKVLIAPAYQLIDEELVRKWKQYAEAGGHLVLTARTGQKKRNGQLWEARWAEPIYQLIGAEVSFFDLLLENGKGEVTMNGETHQWNVWADVLKPLQGTESLAQYSNQFYAGQSAVTYRRVGRGSVTYIGVQTKDGRLEREVLREVYKRAGLQTMDYPAGVYVDWRDGFWVAVNYSSRPADISIPKGAEVLYGATPLKPAEVVVWR
ncbi:MAG TPA: beta-galactosidase [Pyrinomonadaceae bacterium]|nr:beta-galactosidase [Pyrinomonadaceae bacterium]